MLIVSITAMNVRSSARVWGTFLHSLTLERGERSWLSWYWSANMLVLVTMCCSMVAKMNSLKKSIGVLHQCLLSFPAAGCKWGYVQLPLFLAFLQPLPLPPCSSLLQVESHHCCCFLLPTRPDTLQNRHHFQTQTHHPPPILVLYHPLYIFLLKPSLCRCLRSFTVNSINCNAIIIIIIIIAFSHYGAQLHNSAFFPLNFDLSIS